VRYRELLRIVASHWLPKQTAGISHPNHTTYNSRDLYVKDVDDTSEGASSLLGPSTKAKAVTTPSIEIRSSAGQDNSAINK